MPGAEAEGGLRSSPPGLLASGSARSRCRSEGRKGGEAELNCEGVRRTVWIPPHRVPLPGDIHKNKRASECVCFNAAPLSRRAEASQVKQPPSWPGDARQITSFNLGAFSLFLLKYSGICLAWSHIDFVALLYHGAS